MTSTETARIREDIAHADSLLDALRRRLERRPDAKDAKRAASRAVVLMYRVDDLLAMVKDELQVAHLSDCDREREQELVDRQVLVLEAA